VRVTEPLRPLPRELECCVFAAGAGGVERRIAGRLRRDAKFL
jgi:hypothetical protein